MKKQVKVISTLLIAIMLVTSLSSIVFAGTTPQTIIDNVSKPDYGTTGKVQNLGKQITGIIQVVGIVAAVVILMVIGIKYMVGSAEEKAEYKKVMIPYIIGAILLFAASTIVNVVYQLSQNITA